MYQGLVGVYHLLQVDGFVAVVGEGSIIIEVLIGFDDIFDRAYDSFKELYRIHLTDSFYVVRAKTNLKYKIVKWKRRMPKNVLTDAEVKLTGYLSEKKYPESFRLIISKNSIVPSFRGYLINI